MSAREIQRRQIRHRLLEAQDFIDLAADLVEEARGMAENGESAALRTVINRMQQDYDELGRLASGDPPARPQLLAVLTEPDAAPGEADGP